jgi:hypothetical protein
MIRLASANPLANHRAFSTNVNDYPDGMSMYEKESVAAEAVLTAQRKAKKKPSRKTPRSRVDNGKRR